MSDKHNHRQNYRNRELRVDSANGKMSRIVKKKMPPRTPAQEREDRAVRRATGKPASLRDAIERGIQEADEE
jgi:hypothetical protein